MVETPQRNLVVVASGNVLAALIPAGAKRPRIFLAPLF